MPQPHMAIDDRVIQDRFSMEYMACAQAVAANSRCGYADVAWKQHKYGNVTKSWETAHSLEPDALFRLPWHVGEITAPQYIA